MPEVTPSGHLLPKTQIQGVPQARVRPGPDLGCKHEAACLGDVCHTDTAAENQSTRPPKEWDTAYVASRGSRREEEDRGVFWGGRVQVDRWGALKGGLEDFWLGVSLRAGARETQTHTPLQSRSAQGLRGTDPTNGSTSTLKPATMSATPTAHRKKPRTCTLLPFPLCSRRPATPRGHPGDGLSCNSCHRGPALGSGGEVPTCSRLPWWFSRGEF